MTTRNLGHNLAVEIISINVTFLSSSISSVSISKPKLCTVKQVSGLRCNRACAHLRHHSDGEMAERKCAVCLPIWLAASRGVCLPVVRNSWRCICRTRVSCEWPLARPRSKQRATNISFDRFRATARASFGLSSTGTFGVDVPSNRIVRNVSITFARWFRFKERLNFPDNNEELYICASREISFSLMG